MYTAPSGYQILPSRARCRVRFQHYHSTAPLHPLRTMAALKACKLPDSVFTAVDDAITADENAVRAGVERLLKFGRVEGVRKGLHELACKNNNATLYKITKSREAFIEEIRIKRDKFPSKPSPTRRTAPHRTAPHRSAPHRTAQHRTAPHRSAPQLLSPPPFPPAPRINTGVGVFNTILDSLADLCDHGLVFGPKSTTWHYKLLASDSSERRKFQDDLFAAVDRMQCNSWTQVKTESSLKRLKLREEKKVSALHSISHHFAAPSCRALSLTTTIRALSRPSS